MAVWSEVDFRKAAWTDRFEAEYFQPKFLELERVLSGLECLPLEFFASSVNCGPFGSNLLKENYVEDGVVVLRPFNIKDGTIDKSNIVFITDEERRAANLDIYKPGDLVFARVGDIGCGVIPDFDGRDITISPNIIAARIKESEVDSHFLSVFMNTKWGALQMERAMKVVAQPTITVEAVKTLLIPNLPNEEKIKIVKAFDEVQNKKEASKQLYAEAETLLLDALGLNDLDTKHALTYERNFIEVARANRYDAAYFSPRAQSAMEIIGRSGKTLGDVAPLAKRQFKPQSGEEFHYIEIGDLSGDGRAESSPIAGEDAPSRAQWIVRPRDIITSTVRPIRRLSALIEMEQDDFVCSSGFAVLEPREVDPELLLVYLRAPIVCEILDLHTTATMYPAIATDVLLSIPFSAPDSDITAQIISKVRASRDARNDAKNLLESAKRRVEELIERGA